GPKPLIELEKLKTEADWIEAGRIVFEEGDHFQLRTFDPKLIAAARKVEGLPGSPPGTVVSDLRWVPTSRGVALTLGNCSRCHVRYLTNGTRVVGAPGFQGQINTRLVHPIELANRVLGGASPFHMGPDPSGPLFYGSWLYQ